LKSFCFSLFRWSFTWSAVADLPFIFLSLPPPIIRYSDFKKTLVTARKSFRRSKKMSRRSSMTRLRQEGSYKTFWKGEIEERAAAADQRNLTRRCPSPGSLSKWRMIVKSVMKLAQAHDVSA
jgi:hypothetical protein